MSKQQHISVGKISGVFGVKGWVKVFSFTDPRENILTYSPWLLKKGDETKIVN
ncbi:MAG: ribosome maturation factor RimM, partial [Methylobacter sp.]